MTLKLIIAALLGLMMAGCVETFDDDYRDNGSIWGDIDENANGGGQ